MPAFFTKSGWLTPYALACGYRHVETISRDESVILDGDSGHYTVTHWRSGETGATNSSGLLRDGIAAFEGFQSLPQARAFYCQRIGRKPSQRHESNPDVARSVFT